MEKGKNVAVYCGSRYGINPAHTAFAGMAGELLAKNGYTMIYGGGSVGLMGIAADAALAAGGKVVGIIPEVFIAAEQAHRLITELIEVPDLMARKRKMIEAGDAFLILPGGFGTLEEFADTAVHYHIYTEETNRPPIIIANIEGIYDPLARFLKTGNLQNLSLPMNGKTSISSAPSKSFFLFFPEKENPYACLAAGIFICPDFGVHRNFQTFPLILFSFCTSFCSKDLPFILYACFFLLLFIFSQTIPCKNG